MLSPWQIEVKASVPLTLFLLMDFTLHIDAIRMVLSIIYFKGLPNYDVFIFLKIVLVL